MGALEEGQIVGGKYRVERVLGKGGMGVVFAAMHVALRQRVAIKVLAVEPTREVVKRFVREARSVARLRSEHVARVLDVGALEGTRTPYIVLEYLEGDDLLKTVQQRGALPIAEAVDYVLQAADAIAEAHHRGIVHRDLKPSNLFVTTAADNTKLIKVIDFGISKLVEQVGSDPQSAVTQTGQMLGSPLFTAPEQMRSARDVDERADIWSTGVILYWLLTAHLPFDAKSLEELIMMMINDVQPPPPRTHRPDLPEPLESAILRCLHKDRDRRFASIGDLAQAIGPYGSEEAARSVAKIYSLLGQPLCSVDSGIFDEPAPSSRSDAGAAPLSEGRSLRSTLDGPTSKMGTTEALTTVVSGRPLRSRRAILTAVGVAAVLAAVLCARLWG